MWESGMGETPLFWSQTYDQYVGVGGDPTAKTAQNMTLYPDFAFNKNAADLAKTMPQFTMKNLHNNLVKTSAMCFAYQMQPGYSSSATAQKFLQTEYWTTLSQLVMDSGVYSNMFMVPQGKPPVVGGKLATYTTAMGWPGFNNYAIGSVSMTLKKDLTKDPNADFTPEYSMTLASTNRNMQLVTNSGGAEANNKAKVVDKEADDAIKSDPGATSSGFIINLESAQPAVGLTNIFTIDNFVVDEITIRYVTTAEAWANIGGLYAGSVLLITLLFGVTNKCDADGRKVMIFRFLPSETADEWLEPFPETTEKATTDDQIAALKEEMEQIKAAMKTLKVE